MRVDLQSFLIRSIFDLVVTLQDNKFLYTWKGITERQIRLFLTHIPEA